MRLPFARNVWGAKLAATTATATITMIVRGKYGGSGGGGVAPATANASKQQQKQQVFFYLKEKSLFCPSKCEMLILTYDDNNIANE